MKVRKKVGELTGVQVARISLVDRGANRVPFRVMKRCAEGASSSEGQVLDFGKLFKKEKAPAAGGASSTVSVKAIGTVAARIEAVMKAAEAAGLKGFTHRLDKGDAVFLLQDPKADLAACEALALTVDTSVMVDASGALLSKAAEVFPNLGDRAFAPGLLMSLDSLQEGIESAIAEGKVDAVKSAAAAFGQYAGSLSALPVEVLKFEAALTAEPEATPAKVEEPKAQEPTAKADDAPADPAKKAEEPKPADQPDPLKGVMDAIAALGQEIKGVSSAVSAAKSAADEALALARKSDRPSVVAAPAKPGDVPLRLGAAATRKSADVPLLDTALGGKAEN